MVDRIKELCKKKGITIAELERQCEIGNGIIARWKKSKPSFERVAKVANFFGVSPEYLLTGKENLASATGGEISEKELELVTLFRLLPDDLNVKNHKIAHGLHTAISLKVPKAF